jgi:hypothetical protein
VGTRAGAARLLELERWLDLADDDAELLERGGAAWDTFLTALFAEHRELHLFAVRRLDVRLQRQLARRARRSGSTSATTRSRTHSRTSLEEWAPDAARRT